ncbi:O-antigen ligase [Sporosarcina sp.]|uniref:O-antigen ligase family protein n=1 Tax=Sporosarcina sp. TaxID=49982 RepID=UPI0026053960|nr:O-antigen ligase family protein [Sporosarcina sp.]
MNDIHVKENTNPYYIYALLVFVSVFFQSFFIDIGFAIKPFMIAAILIVSLNFKSYVIPRFLKYELCLVIFFSYYCLTGIFATHKYQSLRLIALIVIVLFFYSVLRFLFYRLALNDVEKIIRQSGLLFNIGSLLFFIMGAIQVNFNFVGNNYSSMGLLIDRGMPRLMGTTIDPNIFVLFNSLFFFYFLDRRHKVGTILTIITIVLTFSRGGFIAIGLPLLISWIAFENKGKAKRLYGVVLISLILPFIVNFLFKIDVWKIINARFLAVGDDRGSGRFEIWENALRIFADHPLFGVGIYNFQQYNLHYFSDFHYPHNTFLEVLVESGIVGLVLFLTLFLILLVKLYELQKAKPETHFLFLTLLSTLISMFTLSTAVSEFLFLFFAVCFRYIIENEKRWNKNV